MAYVFNLAYAARRVPTIIHIPHNTTQRYIFLTILDRMSDKKIGPDITLNCEILWIKKAGTVGETIPADMLVGRD